MKKPRSIGPLLLVSGAVLVGTLLLTATSAVTLGLAAQEHGSLEKKIADNTLAMETLQKDKAEQIALYKQYEIGGEIKRTRRVWSTALAEVESTFPGYSVLHNFSGSEEEKATLTVSTESYDDIIALIRIIKDKNPVFKDVFVPAISQTTNEEGKTFFTLPFELFFSDAPTI